MATNAFEVPTRPGQPEVISISLGGVTYTLRLTWNEPAGVWILDIADVNGVPILNGAPLITGANMIDQQGTLIPDAAFIAQSDQDYRTPPTFESLGGTGHLYYVPLTPAPALITRYPLAPTTARATTSLPNIPEWNPSPPPSPPPPPPPPPAVCIPAVTFFQSEEDRFIYLSGQVVRNVQVTTTASPGPSSSSISNPSSILSAIERPYQITTNTDGTTENRLIAFIYSECLPDPEPTTDAPEVTSVSDNFGLVWFQRSAYAAQLDQLPSLSRKQGVRLETWWADSSSLSAGDQVVVTATFSDISFTPNIVITGLFDGGDWDSSPDFPASNVSVDVTQSFPMRTMGVQSVVYLWYLAPQNVLGSNPPPLIQGYPRAGAYYLTPIVALDFNFGNINVHILTIDNNAVGLGSLSAPGGGATAITYPTTNPTTYLNLTGRNFTSVTPYPPLLVVDTITRSNVFLCNTPGMTGGSILDPMWDTSSVGAITTDGTTEWVYLGTVDDVFSSWAPNRINIPPPWDDDLLGGGYYVNSNFFITDSAGTHVFSSNTSGRTGSIEPTWDVSSPGANTVDNEVTWQYVGPFVNPAPGRDYLFVVDAINRN